MRTQVTRTMIYVLTLFLISYSIILVSGLPSVKEIGAAKPAYASSVYSKDGILLDQFFSERRKEISIDELPQHLINAVIASEDRRFFEHDGIDVRRILNATYNNLLNLRIKEGASTITQQTARNLFLTQKPSITRKIREIITALRLEHHYSKEEILKLYLNLAYFGRGLYGVATAAENYFGKTSQQLSLAESGLLVAILPNPFQFDPYRHPERALMRRNRVLLSMRDLNFISDEEFKAVQYESLNLIPIERQERPQSASHFVEYIRQQLLNLADIYNFDIYRDGLSIYTTLDHRMQHHAEHAVEEHIKNLQNKFDRNWNWNTPRNQNILSQALERAIRENIDFINAESENERNKIRDHLLNDSSFIQRVKENITRIQVGLVAIEPHTGEIMAMVGGSDFREQKYGLNRVTQIQRQPGSAFKPFVFTVAIDNGYPPSYVLSNQPITIRTQDGKSWSPSNVGGEYGETLSLREGLRWSVNLIAVRTMLELAPLNDIIDTAHRLGIHSPIPPYESIVLGTAEVNPLEITAAYGVFATNGVNSQPLSITRIVNREDATIVKFTPHNDRVLQPQTAYLMTDMLKDVIKHGTGKNVKNYTQIPAAGKTGTTQDYADGWFIGYTPDLVAGVWVGFDDRRITFANTRSPGSETALPLWALFMKSIYEDTHIGLIPKDFTLPEGVFTVKLCGETHLIAGRYCPDQKEELFIEEHLPDHCTEHRSILNAAKHFLKRIFR